MSSRYQTGTCYQCDEVATNREHVPAKCLYPDGGNWSKLMTVPSCSKHNNATSTADEHLRFLLAAGGASVPMEVRKTAADGVVRLAKMGSGTLAKYGMRMEENTVVYRGGFPVDHALLTESLEKMARALYFHRWNGARKLTGRLMTLPFFLPVDPVTQPKYAAITEMVWQSVAGYLQREKKLGGHPEIFSYQVIDRAGAVTINMEFYKTVHAAVVGPLPPL